MQQKTTFRFLLKCIELNILLFYISHFPGEQFEIEVDTVSHRVESEKPLQVSQTIGPQPVTDVQPIEGAENVTLEWPRPDGRIDFYHVKW